MIFTSPPLWLFENMTINFCLKYFTEVNNCYAIKVVFQTSVCICARLCLRLQDAIVNSDNNTNIAKLLITIYCKCQKILWWKLGTSEEAEVSQYAACNLCMLSLLIRLFKLLVSNSPKFYQTRKYNLGSKKQHLVHLTGVLYVLGLVVFTFFRICHET